MDKQIYDLGDLVYEEASNLFDRIGYSDDFCIQSVGIRAVFGGSNRLIWSPSKGFWPEREYCTPQFLKKWDSIYPQ